MNDEPIAFSCLHCGKRFRVAPVHAGAEVRCAHCSATLRVPKATPKPPDPNEGLVSFSCELCGTRMSEPAERAGQRVECPDCGRRLRIPPPEKRTKKPPAPKIEAYEVYEGDQPRGVDLARAAPETIHFACRVCQTHLQATPEQIGRPVPCPDCGAETPVPQPRLRVKRPQAVGESYQVASEPDPTESVHAGLYESYASSKPPVGYRDRMERLERGATASGRLEPKGIRPLVDLLGLFRSRAIVSVLLGIAFGLGLTGGASLLAYQLIAAGDLYGSLVGIACAVFSVLVGVITLGGTAAFAFAALDQSIEGAPSVGDWPATIPTEWMGDAVRLAAALGVAGVPGGAIAGIAGVAGPVPLLIGGWLALPWVLMSQLDTGSVWGVFSPRLLRTLVYAPVGWLLFYAETAALIAGLQLMVSRAVGSASPLALLVTPVAAAGILLYAWLLGRLAWIASHATPEG